MCFSCIANLKNAVFNTLLKAGAHGRFEMSQFFSLNT